MIKKIIFLIIMFCLFINNDKIYSQNNQKVNTDNKDKIFQIIPQNQYGWDTSIKWNKAREKFKHQLKILSIYEDQKQSKIANCLKSIVAPGWGHFSARNYTKGEILLGLSLLLGVSSIYFYDKSMDSYEKYKNSNRIEDINQYYTDANTAYRTSQIFIGFWVIVWGYTIFDTLGATEKYNRNLWYKLTEEYKNDKISIMPSGIEIKF